MPSPTATARSRSLARTLRQYRGDAGLRQAAVAAYLGRTVQWVCRTENPATCRPSVGDVRALLALYGVTSPAETERVAALAAAVRQPGWWHEYDLPRNTATVIGLEAEATEKRSWECELIPGLLQTEDYARAVIAAGMGDLTAGQAASLVRARLERQKVLRRADPLRLHAVIAEQAVRRPAGPPGVMRAQLLHLAQAAEAGNVTVQVLPSATGAHPATTGAFAVLSFPGGGHDIAFCDTPLGSLYAEDARVITRLRGAFSHLTAAALPECDSMGLLAEVAGSLR